VEIDKAILQTKKAVGHFVGYILMMWGVIWAIGFTATQFSPHVAGWYWAALNTIGTIGTWLIISQSKSKFNRQVGGRLFLALVILSCYAILWGFMLHPSGHAGMAFYLTVGTCAYVMMGLWLSRVLLWLGLIVTGLTLAGLYLLPDWFALWMGITGGGALILSGLSICKSWK